MQTSSVGLHRGFIFSLFCVVSVLTLGLGLSVCLVKSPSEKAAYYLTLSEQYQNKISEENLLPEAESFLLQQSIDMASLAIHYTPYDAQAWFRLSMIYAQQNNLGQAMKARDVASRLGLTPLPTLNAMRNLFPARTLVLSDRLDHAVTVQ